MKSIKSESPFLRALRNRFRMGHYTILTQVEVPSGSGSGIRLADAIILGRLNAFDLSIQGFEIKNSRANWQSELKNPMKAEIGASYCDGWSLLTYPGVADPEEIPPAWGHWVLDSKELKILKEAPPLHPKPVDRAFLIRLMDAVLSQAGQNIELISSQVDYDRGFAAGKEEGYDRADKSQDFLASRLAKKERELEDALGRLRAGGLLHKSVEEIDAIKRIVQFSHTFGYKGSLSLLRAVESFAAVDVDTLRSSLRELHSTAANITKTIGDNIGIIEVVEEFKKGSEPDARNGLLKVVNEATPKENTQDEDQA